MLGGLFVLDHPVGDHPGRLRSSSPADGCSGWRRCSTTSSSPGWGEVTIVIRFWIIAGLFVALGLGRVLRGVGGRRDVTPGAPSHGGSTRTATPTGPGCGSSSPGSACPGSPPPTRCSSAAPGSSCVDGARPGRGEQRARRRPRRPRRRRPRSARSTRPRCRVAGGRRPRRHLAGLAPRPAAARRGGRAPASRCGARWSWPGGCGPATGAAPVADRHRHQRQDHHRADARARCCAPPACARVAAGNVGTPAARGGAAPGAATTCIAVELSSFQLHWSQLAAAAAPRPASTSRPTTSTGTARSTATPPTRAGSTRGHRGRLRLQRRRPGDRAAGRARPTSVEGCRAVGFTLGVPGAVDARRRRRRARATARSSSSAATSRRRAGHAGRRRAAGGGPLAPHNVANALAAAALARAYGVPPAAVRDGPARLRAPSRTASPQVGRGRRRALGRRLQGHQPARRRRRPWPRSTHVVWIAGGLAKGADVRRPGRAPHAGRLRGAVLHRPRPRA